MHQAYFWNELFFYGCRKKQQVEFRGLTKEKMEHQGLDGDDLVMAMMSGEAQSTWDPYDPDEERSPPTLLSIHVNVCVNDKWVETTLSEIIVDLGDTVDTLIELILKAQADPMITLRDSSFEIDGQLEGKWGMTKNGICVTWE
jgi:hypothetical protein